MSESFLDGLHNELELLVEPVIEAAGDTAALRRLLASIGADETFDASSPLLQALQQAVNLKSAIDIVANAPQPSFDGIAALLAAGGAVLKALGTLDASSAQQLEGLGEDLVGMLTGEYLRQNHPLIYALASLATLVDPIETSMRPGIADSGNVVRSPFFCAMIRFDRVDALVNGPENALGSFYFPNGLATVADANAASDLLFPRIGSVLTELGVPWTYGLRDEALATLGDAAAFVDHAFQVYIPSSITGADADAGLSFALSSDDRGGLGLVVSPFGALTFSTTLDAWTFVTSLGAEIEALAIGKAGPTFIASAGTVSIDGTASATLAPPSDGTPAFVWGAPDGTRLELGGAKASVEVDASLSDSTIAVSAGVSSCAIVIAAEDGDSFLKAVLPANGLRATFEFGLTYSTKGGLSFTGGAGLEATLPVTLSLGGVVALQGIQVALGADASGLTFETSAIASLSIGPVHAVVDRIGIAANVTAPQTGANLGVVDLDLGFKPPSGVGLSIDASVITGGGFLEHNGDIYAGALDLSICGYAVKSFGLIQTSGGAQPGYSFVAVISVEFVPEITLPFDFTLEGVGGFIGINRTISVDAVEAALWAHHLDGLLFPSNPVAIAPQLLSALAAYFPPAEGRYVFGPLAKIGWAADIVTGEAALLLELPEPIRLLLIGDVQVGVPSNSPQLVLHISFDGGIDFGKQLAFFDATLNKSRLESYPISGDLAFRYSWGDPGVFALALGGFNPQFQPPAGFPTLKRLAISISSSVARIEAQSYLALTSNTLQFGARVELTAGTGSFNVHGWLGFNALCERNPLAFEFDLSAGVDLRAGSDVLASVHLDGKLSGPTPWHIAGKASLSLLFFSVSVHFDKTWGSTATALPAPDPLPELTAALSDPSSWSGVLPASVRATITPVGSPADAGAALLLDPAGALRVSQRVIPLDQPISRFAGTPLGQSTTLSLSSLTAFGNPTTPSGTTSEEFAPAQFLDLTDAEKLSLPSFSLFDAGVELAGDAVDLGQSARTRAVITSITYITTTVDSRINPPPKSTYIPSVTAVLGLSESANTLPPGLGRYRPALGMAPLVTLAPDTWTITSTSDLSVRTDIPCDGSKLNAHLALQQYLAANPDEIGALQITLTQEAA